MKDRQGERFFLVTGLVPAATVVLAYCIIRDAGAIVATLTHTQQPGWAAFVAAALG